MLVVVRRLEGDALVLEDLEQPRLHRRIHLADLVDEQHAAVRARHQPQLRLRDAALGEIASGALIDRIVHAAEQRVRGLAMVPAQRRPGRFDERGIGGERRVRTRFRELQREPRDRRLADARRSVQDHVLRMRRGQLGDQRLDRRLLPDDFVERARAQHVERRARQAARVERLELGQPLLCRGRLRARFLAHRFEPQLAHVLVMARDHLRVDLRLEPVVDGVLRDELREPVLDVGDDLLVLRLRRTRLERRILEDEPLERQQTIRDRLRAHLFERAELAGAHDDLVGPQRVGEHVVERRDLAAELLVGARSSHATWTRGQRCATT